MVLNMNNVFESIDSFKPENKKMDYGNLYQFLEIRMVEKEKKRNIKHVLLVFIVAQLFQDSGKHEPSGISCIPLMPALKGPDRGSVV